MSFGKHIEFVCLSYWNHSDCLMCHWNWHYDLFVVIESVELLPMTTKLKIWNSFSCSIRHWCHWWENVVYWMAKEHAFLKTKLKWILEEFWVILWFLILTLTRSWQSNMVHDFMLIQWCGDIEHRVNTVLYSLYSSFTMKCDGYFSCFWL